MRKRIGIEPVRHDFGLRPILASDDFNIFSMLALSRRDVWILTNGYRFGCPIEALIIFKLFLGLVKQSVMLSPEREMRRVEKILYSVFLYLRCYMRDTA